MDPVKFIRAFFEKSMKYFGQHLLCSKHDCGDVSIFCKQEKKLSTKMRLTCLAKRGMHSDRALINECHTAKRANTRRLHVSI